jgi:hypothetical protein
MAPTPVFLNKFLYHPFLETGFFSSDDNLKEGKHSNEHHEHNKYIN